MTMQDYPICWDCGEQVESNPIYEAICGHDECPSSIFHGLCLMRWREKREEVYKTIQKWFDEHSSEFRSPWEEN